MSHNFPAALVVDDSRTCRAITVALLEHFGFLVTPAANGQQAVEATTDTNFDIILMDCDMPVMEGLVATLAIRQVEAAAHVLIIGVTSKANRAECLSVGMDDHIHKPLTLKLLITALQRWGWTEIRSKNDLHEVLLSLELIRGEVQTLAVELRQQHNQLEYEKASTGRINSAKRYHLELREDALRRQERALEMREKFLYRREQAAASIDEQGLDN